MAAEQSDGFEERRAAFVKEIDDYLAKGDTQKAFEALHDLNNYEKFKASGFDLMPIAGKHINELSKSKTPGTFRCAVQLLERISREFSPKEAYLELLELLEDGDDVKFATVLDVVKSCLLIMPNHRGKSVSWSCDAIVRHLCNMETPKLEGEADDVTEGGREDVESTSNSALISNISSVYDAIVGFFDPLVREVADSAACEIPSDHMEEYKDSLFKCLVKCLGRPLVHMDLSVLPFKDKSAQLLTMLDTFVVDPLSLLKHVDLSFGCVELLEEDAVVSEYTNVSLGCYFYLTLGDADRILRISHVYSTKYLFERSLAMTFDLMGTDEAPLILKGLQLLDSVLDRMSSKSLELGSIRDSVLSKFMEMLTRTMVHNEVKEVRQLSVKAFPKFLIKFTAEGRYLVLLNANQLSAHPGFVGYAITLVKEEVREALDSQDPDRLKYFTGKKLIDLMSRYCRMSGLVEADLQSHTEQIMSCLNLIRYILLRDKNNDTKAASYLYKVEESYLEPVKKACAFARGLYEDYKAEVNNPGDKKMRVNISGCEDFLPEMSPEETVRMMNENLTRVDMIDYLASRVSQCLVEYKQNVNPPTDIPL